MKFEVVDTFAGGIAARHRLVRSKNAAVAEITTAADGIQIAGTFPLITDRATLRKFCEELEAAWADYEVAKDK